MAFVSIFVYVFMFCGTSFCGLDNFVGYTLPSNMHSDQESFTGSTNSINQYSSYREPNNFLGKKASTSSVYGGPSISGLVNQYIEIQSVLRNPTNVYASMRDYCCAQNELPVTPPTSTTHTRQDLRGSANNTYVHGGESVNSLSEMNYNKYKGGDHTQLTLLSISQSCSLHSQHSLNLYCPLPHSLYFSRTPFPSLICSPYRGDRPPLLTITSRILLSLPFFSFLRLYQRLCL